MSSKQTIEWHRTSEELPPNRRKVLVQGGIAYYAADADEIYDLDPGWYTITGKRWPGYQLTWVPQWWAFIPEPPEATSTNCPAAEPVEREGEG